MTIPVWLYWAFVVMYGLNLVLTACKPAPAVQRGVGVAVAGLFLVLLLATASRP